MADELKTLCKSYFPESLFELYSVRPPSVAKDMSFRNSLYFHPYFSDLKKVVTLKKSRDEILKHAEELMHLTNFWTTLPNGFKYLRKIVADTVNVYLSYISQKMNNVFTFTKIQQSELEDVIIIRPQKGKYRLYETFGHFINFIDAIAKDVKGKKIESMFPEYVEFGELIKASRYQMVLEDDKQDTYEFILESMEVNEEEETISGIEFSIKSGAIGITGNTIQYSKIAGEFTSKTSSEDINERAKNINEEYFKKLKGEIYSEKESPRFEVDQSGENLIEVKSGIIVPNTKESLAKYLGIDIEFARQNIYESTLYIIGFYEIQKILLEDLGMELWLCSNFIGLMGNVLLADLKFFQKLDDIGSYFVYNKLKKEN
jgi:hypothetical protein